MLDDQTLKQALQVCLAVADLEDHVVVPHNALVTPIRQAKEVRAQMLRTCIVNMMVEPVPLRACTACGAP
jgi:hypothetical protein